jgi:hypothetical protein
MDDAKCFLDGNGCEFKWHENWIIPPPESVHDEVFVGGRRTNIKQIILAGKSPSVTPMLQ